METAPPGPVIRLLGHTTVVLVLLTIAYFALPLRVAWGEQWSLVRLVVSVAVLGLLAFVLRRQARRSRRVLTQPHLRILWLLTALYVLVLLFALVYALVAFYVPDQFANMTDRVDSLYYSVTLVATVGFGDIYAEGTLAQLLATVHMVINLIYIGTALRMLSTVAPAGPPRI